MLLRAHHLLVLWRKSFSRFVVGEQGLGGTNGRKLSKGNSTKSDFHQPIAGYGITLPTLVGRVLSWTTSIGRKHRISLPWYDSLVSLRKRDANADPILAITRFIRYVPALKNFLNNRCPGLLQQVYQRNRELYQEHKNRPFGSNPVDYFEHPVRGRGEPIKPDCEVLEPSSIGTF